MINNRIFISYSHTDKKTANKLNVFLQKNGFETIIDSKEMSFTQNIEEFIKTSVTNSFRTILIISRSSLLSQWVVQEFLTSIRLTELIGRGKIILCYENSNIFSPYFQDNLLKDAIKEVSQINNRIKKRIKNNFGILDLQNELQRKKEVIQNLDLIFREIKENYSIDISEFMFEKNLKKLILELKKENELERKKNFLKKRIINSIFRSNINDIISKLINSLDIYEKKEFLFANSINMFFNSFVTAKTNYINKKITKSELIQNENDLKDDLIDLILNSNFNDLNTYSIIFSDIIRKDIYYKNIRVKNNIKKIENKFNTWIKKKKLQPVSMIIFDIDDFTVINNKYGTKIGDKLKYQIELITKNLLYSTINSNLKFINNTKYYSQWLGLDEFMILLYGFNNNKTNKIALQIKKEIYNYNFSFNNMTLYASVSIGFSEFNYLKNETIQNCILRNLEAVKEAKLKGKNKIEKAKKYKVIYPFTNKEMDIYKYQKIITQKEIERKRKLKLHIIEEIIKKSS